MVTNFLKTNGQDSEGGTGEGGFMPEFSSTGITRSDPARQSGWENGVLIRKKSWHFLILMNRPERQRIGVLQRSDSVWEGGGG